jgi:type IV secretion system protein VirB10
MTDTTPQAPEPRDRLDTRPRPVIRRLTPRHLMFAALAGLVVLIVISFTYAKRSFAPQPGDPTAALAGPPAMEPAQIRQIGIDETAPRPDTRSLEELLAGSGRRTPDGPSMPAFPPPRPQAASSPAQAGVDRRLAAPLGPGSRRRLGSSGPAAGGADALAAERARLLDGLERLERAGGAGLGAATFPPADLTPPAAADSPARPSAGTIGLAEATFVAPRSPFLRAGTLIPLVLLHHLDSRQPGLVRAQVTGDVLDATARRILIPRGTLALGFQTGQPVLGQERLEMHWSQLHYPDHRILVLPDSPGAAPDGSLGPSGHVNQRWRARYGAALILTLIGAGAQLSQPQRSATAANAASEGQVVAAELGLQFGRLSQEILQRYVDLPPIVELQPGARLALLTTDNITIPID